MSIDALLRENQDVWKQSVSNELGRLAGGIRDVSGNEAIEFISQHKVPSNKKVTYVNMVCDVRPKKDCVYRTQLGVGGNKLDYYGDKLSPAASLIENKLLINSVIFDTKKGTIFLTLDIKAQFLQSLLLKSEYMQIHSNFFSKT